jgi:fibronectin-binding autotransporter adhesin
MLAIVCTVFSGLLMNGIARADMWWDTNGATTGSSGATTAPGSWSTATTNWSASSAGTSATQGWTSGQTAVFAAGTNATGTSVVNLTQNLTLAGIRVEEGLWNVASSGVMLSFSNNALAVDSAVNIHLDALYSPSNGVITKTGTGYFGSDRAQTSFAGKWVINAGNVEFGTDTAIGVVPASTVPDQITLNGGNVYSAVTRTFDTKRGITLGPNGGGINLSGTTSTVTWQGPITGTSGGPLNLSFGTAVVLTNANNNYDGQTVLRGATLKLGASNVIPDTSVVNFTLSGSKLQLNGNDETVKSLSGSLGSIDLGSRTLTLNNPAGEVCGTPISASAGGKLVKNGAGAITLSGSSPNFLGEFVLNDGTVGLGNNNALGNAAGAIITINGGAFSPLQNDVTIAAAVPANLNADFSVNDMFSPKPRKISISGVATMNASRTITVSGSSTLVLSDLRQTTAGLSVTKQGNGALELGGATNTTNRFTGDVHVLAGRLQVGSSGFIGTGNNTIHLAGGSFNTAASRSVLAELGIANPINVAADAAITTTSPVPVVEWHISSDSVGGSGKITFRNDAESKTNVFMPQLSGSGAAFAPGPIEIANGTSGTTALHSYNATGTTQTFSNVISGTGSYTRNATAANTGGTTVFSAANTYSGGTNVSRGTLLVNNTSGSGTGSGAVTVGLSGILGGTGRIGGAVTNGGKISPGASIGTLIVNSNVSMSANSRLAIEVSEATADRLVVHGNLDLSAMEFLDVTGSGTGPWLIATYSGSLMGVFNQVTAGFVVDYATNGQILLNVAALPGDYDSDGKVDAADYVVWRKTPDSHGGVSTGYGTWRTNFGRSSNGGGGLTDEGGAVPEPASVILLLGLGVLLLGRRTRR